MWKLLTVRLFTYLFSCLVLQMDNESVCYASKTSIHARKELIRPMSRKDIFYSGSVLNLPEYQSQRSLAGYRASIMSLPRYSSKNIAVSSHVAPGDQADIEKGPRKYTMLSS